MIDSTDRRIGVYGLAVRDATVLLARVAPPNRAAGWWTLPGGGMQWGEGPLEALEREIREETGLASIVADPVLIRSGVLDVPEEHPRPIHNLQIVYRVDVVGEPRPEVAGSTDDARWIPLDGVGSLDLVPLAVEALTTL